MNLKKKALINSIGSLILYFAQWLISVMIIKLTGYGDAGIFSLAMSVSNIFSFIANYNIRNYQISDAKKEFTQKQYFLSRIITVLISFVICIIYLALFTDYRCMEQAAIILYLLYSNINVISDVMLGTVQLDGHLEINGYSNAIRGTACFMAFAFAYAVSKDLNISLAIMAAATAVVTFVYDRKMYHRHTEKSASSPKSDFIAAGSILRRCFLLMLSCSFPIITTAVPRTVIDDLYGEEALGYFATVFTPTALIITLAPALILSVIPQLSESWKSGNFKECRLLIFKSYGICAAFTVAALLAALAVGRPVMKLVFNEQILDYYNLLYWAIAATGINACTSCGNAVLITMRKNAAVAVSAFVSMAVVSLLSGVLIKSEYIYGAAYALLAAYSVQTIMQIAVIIFSYCKEIKHSKNNAPEKK